jgi:UDP-N-acetylmuramate: L-alanyl-gamma-D-glutamyl-meso-diaminopimelate ligase
VFQQGFTEAFDAADETVLAAVFRSSLPVEQRLDAEAVVAGVNARGRHARFVPSVPEIVDLVSREALAGDLVVVMSNGGFDGIHDKLLAALAAR